jgi:hypothetical protein
VDGGCTAVCGAVLLYCYTAVPGRSHGWQQPWGQGWRSGEVAVAAVGAAASCAAGWRWVVPTCVLLEDGSSLMVES